MNDTVLRFCRVGVLAAFSLGCTDVADNNPNPISIANLQGVYDLDMAAMADKAADDGGFKMISELLVIDGDTTVFTPTFEGARPFTLAGNTVTLTGGGYDDIVQASFGDNGNRLTLVDEIDGDIETFVCIRRGDRAASDEISRANLKGRYELDVADSSLKTFTAAISGKLEVTRNMAKVSLTFSQTRPFTISGNAIKLRESDGTTTLLHTIRSRDGISLTLTFAESGESFVYLRR